MSIPHPKRRLRPHLPTGKASGKGTPRITARSLRKDTPLPPTPCSPHPGYLHQWSLQKRHKLPGGKIESGVNWKTLAVIHQELSTTRATPGSFFSALPRRLYGSRSRERAKVEGPKNRLSLTPPHRRQRTTRASRRLQGQRPSREVR